MTNFEQQLRDAMRAAVAGAQPPDSVMEKVRRRYRRRNARLAAASVAALAFLVAVVPVASALSGGDGRPAHGRTSGAPLFPGGGRLLLDRRGTLEWLYPDGKTTRIAHGFDGAKISAGELLAWRFTSHGASYYTMKLDGSQRRLVLPAERGKQFDDIQAQLSPDGSRLAYIRQQVISQRKVVRTLWVAELATGQRVDLGPVWWSFGWSSLAWRDDTTILATSADAKTLQLVNTVTRARSTYLAVTDRALVSAYEQARPGAGPPASIGSDGLGGSGTSAALAVWLDGRNTDPPAEILVERGRILAFAPRNSPQVSLTMTWGPNGVFLLQSQPVSCDCPGGGDSVTYAGTVHSERLTRVQTILNAWNAAAVNPESTVTALGYGGIIDFAPLPSPACDAVGKCLHFQMKQVTGRGTLLAWDRG
jgi:hypothetical protein